MGLFDYFRSSYNLGEQFTNVVCQTKDMEDGIGGTMSDYWLDPSGQLWRPSYIGTHDFVEIPEDDPRHSEVGLFNFEWIPTGVHGKYQPYYITKYVEVYPANWQGAWEDWPRLKLHLKAGKLIDWEDTTGR